VSAYDFSAFRRVVDVGGGHGSLLAAVLQSARGLHGVLFDRSEVTVGAGKILRDELGERCEIIAGDFFQFVPSGGDLYMLKFVLHDWGDEFAIKILRNCRTAMSENCRLLVIESVVPPGNEPHYSKFMDLNMLVLNHQGMERTEAEYRSLFAAAGFRLTNIIATRSPMNLIEGLPVEGN
jgi:hypothetical protein